jgi:hypothetical protein
VEWRETAVVLTYSLAALVFVGSVALSLIRGRFGLRILLVATAAACIALGLLTTSYEPLPD